jgi:homoserine acetyltransferase
MDAFSEFEKMVDISVLKQQPASTRKIDTQVLVDEGMRKKWDKAKRGKDTTAALIAINEMLLHDVNRAIRGDLVELVEQYARLSLVGSCSAQVRSAISYLELQCRSLEAKGYQVLLERVNERLGHMKRKLELLNKMEDAQKGVSG